MTSFDKSSAAPFEPSTVVELLRRRALEQPDRLAYTYLADGEQEEATLTYAQLDRKARAIAALLQSLETAGGRALLLYPSGLDYVAAFFGCLYAGVIAVPAYPPRPSRRNRNFPRLSAIVNGCRPSVALSTAPILSAVSKRLDENPDLAAMRWLSTDDLSDALADEWQEPSVGGNSLAFLQYTSGSTAAPKGVMVSHGNLLHNQRLIRQAFGQTEQSVVVGWLPLYHDMGLIGNVLQPLYLGAPCYLMSPTAFLLRPFRWLQAVSRYGATTSGGPNFAYDLCARKVTEAERDCLDLSRWTTAFNGAEPVRPETLKRFAEAFAPCGFRAESFAPCYGLAEATLIVSGGRPAGRALTEEFDPAALELNRAVAPAGESAQARSLVNCGQTLPGQRIVVVDPETCAPCPPEGVGEIWVAGPSVTHGYWNRPEETAQTFHAYLGATGEGPFLRTGDLGFMHDGGLFVTGRLKDLLVIRGRNHYPQDIELTAERSHAALRAGCGAAFSIEEADEERLVVVQEVDGRARADAGEMLEAIRQAVTEEHEVAPHAVVLVAAGGVPKTSSGKIQRHASRAKFLAGSFEVVGEWRAAPAAAPSAEEFAAGDAPAGAQEIEAWLVAHLAARFGVDACDVDVNQSLARYGFDSLAAIELMHAVETRLGVSLSMSSLLQSPTLAQLAAEVGAQMSAAAGPAVSSPPSSSPTPPPASAGESHALSHGQQALWFLYRLAPESAAYNLSGAARVREGLDAAALRQAFQALSDRHAALRTTFAADEGKPVQRVHPLRAVAFDEIDATGWSEGELAERLSAESERPFDLSAGPVMRVSLFSRSPREHVVLLSLHHIVADFWSLAVMAHDLGRLYHSRRAGAPAPPPLRLAYADHVRWQNETLSGPEGERLWSYWQKQLDGDLPVLNLPTDRPPPPAQSYRGDTHSFALSPELTAALRALAREQSATLYVTLLAAFQTLLHRYTEQKDIIVGSPTAGRTRAESAGLVGYFVNPVALRADFSGDPTFKVLLGEVRRTALAAFEHQEYPFALLVERLQPARDASRPPIFQTMFALQKSHLPGDEGLTAFALGEAGARVRLGELELESIALPQRVAQFELSLVMAESDGRLAGAWQYSTDLFDAATVARMSAHFETLLASICAHPERRVSALPLLAADERRQLLEGFNQTARDYATDLCLHELFEERARATPDALAVVYEETTLTYRELNERANRLAHHLRRLGAGPDALVGVCLERSAEVVVALVAVSKAGAAYVPLDPDYPRERLSYMVADAGVRIVLTQENLLDVLPGGEAALLCLDRDADALARESSENPQGGATPDNLAYVIYTSGSTGRPKGAMLAHRGVVNCLRWMQETYRLDATDSFLLKTSLNFDPSVWEIFWTLAAGACVHVARPGGELDAAYLARYVAEQNVTTVYFVPSMLRVFVDEPRAARCASSLRRVICGGEALPVETMNRFFSALPGVELHHSYGPTETSIAASEWECERDWPRRQVSMGRPLGNTRAYVLDAGMSPVPAGVAGELYVGGAGVGRGYLNRPALTAERFVPDPFAREAGARLYRTGDLVRQDAAGRLEFVGRVDHQVKIRGFRIELEEIESLLAAHEEVREALVVAREDEPGGRRLVAYVVAAAEAERRESVAGGQQLTAGELRRHLKARLPDYMIPSAFVFLAALPLSPNGKVDRAALPAPEASRAESEGGYAAPASPAEEMLAAIWSSVLRVERVGRDDNFFELGGHSLLATQLMSRVHELFGVEVPLRRLFETPTVAGLAALVGQHTAHRDGGEWTAIQARRRGGRESAALTATAGVAELTGVQQISRGNREMTKDTAEGNVAEQLAAGHDHDPSDAPEAGAELDAIPPSFAQQRLWFLDQLDPGNPVYNIPAVVRIGGRLSVAALEQTLTEIVRRHEALRTTFATRDAHPVQLIGPPYDVRLPVADLSALAEAERAAEADRLLQAEAQRPFDLAKGPLLRASLVRLGPTDHLFMLTMHHVVSDGWSMGVLIREIVALYEASIAGRPSPLPELEIQYADYALWQREWLQGEVLDEQVAYWKEQLASPGVLELPTDGPRPPVQSFNGAVHQTQISATLYEALKAFSQREGVTLFMTLLAAFKVMLARYSGQTDLIVGTPIAGRTRVETEPLIGLFVNTLALRTDLSGDPTFRELLARVREVTLGAYAHQDVPFERLVEELQPERSLSHTPFFQVMIMLKNTPLPDLTMAGLPLSRVDVATSTAKFDVTLLLEERDGGITAQWEYNTDLFAPPTVARMSGHFETLLESVLAQPAERVSQLPLLTQAERQQLLVGWNDTARDYPGALCLHELFAEQAARTPDAVALVAEAERLTYRELDARAEALAARLRGLGVGPEVRVGVLLARTPRLLVGLLGILKAGGVYVPLDPAYPRERVAFMVEDAAMSVLLTQRELLDKLPPSSARVVCVEDDSAGDAPESGERPAAPAAVGVTPDNLAYVIYTSGSTGRPKGVAITHKSASVFLHWAHETFSREELGGVLASTSVCFDLSVFELFAPLSCGGSVVLAENALALPTHPAAGEVTLVNTVPSAMAELARSRSLPPAVTTVNLAGEPLKLSLVEQVYGHETVARVLNLYGPSEDTTYSTYVALARGGSRQPTIGRPVANTQVYLLDKSLQLVPVGVAGELYIGGDGLARGYLNRPDLTAEKFVPNPFSAEPGRRLYRTGDSARRTADGELEFLGRGDQQVKVRGYRIELGEIEAALARHESVREAVVVAREDESGDKRLVAYVVGVPGAELPGVTALRAHLRERLPEYMIPSAFVFLAELPLTPNGKVDRKALPDAEQSRPELESSYVAPRNATEEALAAIWAEVLRVERVGVEDNFFELGGHSLLATQLMARVRETMKVDVLLRSMFESPTVAGLARYVEQSRSQQQRSVPKIQPRQRGRQSQQQVLAKLEQLAEGDAREQLDEAASR